MRKLSASVAIILTAGVSGCANLHDTAPPQIVKVEVPVACPDRRLAAPFYPDNAKAISSIPKGHMKEIEQLQLKGTL